MFTADNEQTFTVTLDLSVQACKKASLSLANVASYVLHAVRYQIECRQQSAGLNSSLYTVLAYVPTKSVIKKEKKQVINILTKMQEI